MSREDWTIEQREKDVKTQEEVLKERWDRLGEDEAKFMRKKELLRSRRAELEKQLASAKKELQKSVSDAQEMWTSLSSLETYYADLEKSIKLLFERDYILSFTDPHKKSDRTEIARGTVEGLAKIAFDRAFEISSSYSDLKDYLSRFEVTNRNGTKISFREEVAAILKGLTK